MRMSRIETIATILRRIRPSKYGWSGNYASWKAASEASSGYNSSEILQKVLSATKEIKNGTAVYERDSVLFDRIEYSWPLLSCLLWITAKNGGSLHVLDFGGSLGSSYFQNRKFLEDAGVIRWSVVEQTSFVEVGQKEIANETLSFHSSISQVIETKGVPDVLLMSCVLPYLENPYNFILEITNYNIPYIIIDNTFFNYSKGDRLTVQKVPPAIYDASYPSWFLDYTSVKNVLAPKYSIWEEFRNELSLYLDGVHVQYQGLLAVSKK
jgi:putative methyltransferase (TIGR04325 family)